MKNWRLNRLNLGDKTENIKQAFVGIKDALRIISKTIIVRTPTQKYEREKDTILKTKADLGIIMDEKNGLNNLLIELSSNESNKKENSALYELLVIYASELEENDEEKIDNEENQDEDKKDSNE